MTAKPHGKPQAYVDSDGYVYPTKRTSGMPTIIFICVGFALLGALAMMNHFQIPYSALREPLPTASVPTRTPLPTPPNNPPAGDGDRPLAEPISDYGIAAYNAQQEERAAEFAQEAAQEGQGSTGAPPAEPQASEAEINAWLEGPVSTPTPLPEPGEAGFAASFEDAPECSAFIGYLPGDPCIPILTAVAAGE